MGPRVYVGAAIGFLLGFLISQWFVANAPVDTILLGMQTASAIVGAIAGLGAGAASKAGNQGRAVLAAAAGLVGCLLVGLVILIYIWITH